MCSLFQVVPHKIRITIYKSNTLIWQIVKRITLLCQNKCRIVKKEFAEFLSKEALNASADQFVTQKRIEILQLVGWDNSVADAITTCGATRKSKLKEIGSNVFETMKANTKDTEERRALVEAYSSWEAYVTSQTPLAKQDFD